MDFKAQKRSYWIAGAAVVAIILISLFYLWFRSYKAIRYAVAPSSVMAVTGNDYESTLKKLHHLSLVQEIENDDVFEILGPNDFLKLDIAHSPDLKKLIKDKKHILSFKVDANNQLQSLLAFEGNKELYAKLINEILGPDYDVTSYSSPAGEIKEAYNSLKKKELVLGYTNGIIVIANEALFIEETLNSIRNHKPLFNRVKLNFTSNYIYIKETALQKWVDGITRNHTSEFFQWFENIDEIEFRINDEGTLARTKLYFNKDNKNQKIRNDNVPFQLENWLQNITSNYIGFHPDTSLSEIRLLEIYRCYTNLQDENISNNTFITAQSSIDSGSLQVIFRKHSIAHYKVLNDYIIYKFGKYPFFKNFCNGCTPDLPETFVTLAANNVFIVSSSVSSMIPILEKINRNPINIKNSARTVFVMQMQPQNLLPYFSKIINEDYRENILGSSFLEQLDFVQYRIDTIDGYRATGNVFFSKNAIEGTVNTELLWSKILDHDAKYFTVTKGKNEGTNFILFQDEQDVLHCLDFKTNEIFQKFILGDIQSKIFNTDLYHNGQSQFIFNTTNQIFALNSRGKDLNSFPKPINNEGMKGMYLFDMGDKYEYFFVHNNLIYGFDAGGVSLKDWRPKQAPVWIHKDLLQFRKRNNNYIVGINQRGEILIWNRFGKRVEKDINFATVITSDFCITPPVNKKYRPELITSDTTGRIYSITLDSLRRKEYRYKLTSDNTKYFITQTIDSTFQKIIFQNRDKLLFFDRYTQTTDTLALTNKFKLMNIFTVNQKFNFIVISNGNTSKIISAGKKVVADRIEGDIIEILPTEIPNNYFVVTFDQLKRVNLYKFSL